jgi:hypothetical protein
VEWILLAQDIVHWLPPVNSNETSDSIKCREFLDYLSDYEGYSINKVPLAINIKWNIITALDTAHLLH